MNKLINWNEIDKQIDEAKDLKTIIEMQEQLDAFKILAMQADGSLKTANHISKYRFYLEQKAGEIYSKLEDEKGGDKKSENYKNQSLPRVTIDSPKQKKEKQPSSNSTKKQKKKKKKDLTIKQKAVKEVNKSTKTLNKWVKESDVPKEIVEEFGINCTEKKVEFTSKGIMNFKKDKDKKIDKEKREVEFEKKEIKINVIEKKNVILGDFKNQKFDDNSFDHIFTDPPYAKKYLSEWEYLAETAKRVLKPGGFCICYSGTYYLPTVMSILSKYLGYYWQCILLHSGGNQFIQARKLNTGYKPILIFAKEPIKKLDTAIYDLIKGTGKEKDSHKWQQAENEAIDILEKFTKIGDRILDPFAGSGTIHIACKKTKRIPISVEKDEKNIKVIYERISNAI